MKASFGRWFITVVNFYIHALMPIIPQAPIKQAVCPERALNKPRKIRSPPAGFFGKNAAFKTRKKNKKPRLHSLIRHTLNQRHFAAGNGLAGNSRLFHSGT